jgi:hypothetical protein
MHSMAKWRNGEHEALIDIRTLEVIAGSLPKRALNLTIEWTVEHRNELPAWAYAETRHQKSWSVPRLVEANTLSYNCARIVIPSMC